MAKNSLLLIGIGLQGISLSTIASAYESSPFCLEGSMETRVFIDALSEVMMRPGASPRDRTGVLILIAHLVTKVPA